MRPYYDDRDDNDDNYGTTFAAQKRAAEYRERGVEVTDVGHGYYEGSSFTILPDGTVYKDM